VNKPKRFSSSSHSYIDDAHLFIGGHCIEVVDS